jgi:hypothetical protein
MRVKVSRGLHEGVLLLDWLDLRMAKFKVTAVHMSALTNCYICLYCLYWSVVSSRRKDESGMVKDGELLDLIIGTVVYIYRYQCQIGPANAFAV